MNRFPFLVVLGTSVLASIAVTVVVQELRPRETPPPPATAATAATAAIRLDDVEQRLTEVEQRVARLQDVAPPAAATAAATTPQRMPVETVADGTHDVVVALEQRLERLERSLAGAGDTRSPLPAREPPQPSAPDDQRTIVDPAATVAEKLAAHHRLRRNADAYTPAMVDEMVRIATADADPEARAQVWCWFDGSSHVPALVGPLLHALYHDPSPRPREEAAETLGNYTEAPGVLAALEDAAARDPDHRVRDKARRTLAEARGLASPFEALLGR